MKEKFCCCPYVASVGNACKSVKRDPLIRAHRRMEFQQQEIFEYNTFHQSHWMKNHNDWNQNVTEDMMNYNQGMGYFQASDCHQQYNNYYDQSSYYVEGAEYPSTQFSSSPESTSSVQEQSYQQAYYETQVTTVHQEEETKKQVFLCTICNMRFSRLYHLKRHFETQGHQRSVNEANVGDPAEFLLQYYKQTRDSQKFYECDRCSKRYKNKISLKRHYASTHDELKNSMWTQFNAIHIQNNYCPVNCQSS